MSDLEKALQNYHDALDEFYYDGSYPSTSEQDLLKDLETEIYNAAKHAVKDLRALEIIIKKTVSIFQMSCCKNVDEYNDLKFFELEKLTKDEFESIREVLQKYEKHNI